MYKIEVRNNDKDGALSYESSEVKHTHGLTRRLSLAVQLKMRNSVDGYC